MTERTIEERLGFKTELKQCKFCNKVFTSQEYLERHFELVHMSYTPFDKEFSGMRRYSHED